MKRIGSIARNLVRQDDGAALVEYGMLVLLIAVVCIFVVQALGKKVKNGFSTVNSVLP
jgi:Flp pilus assembly pilin Flp